MVYHLNQELKKEEHKNSQSVFLTFFEIIKKKKTTINTLLPHFMFAVIQLNPTHIYKSHRDLCKFDLQIIHPSPTLPVT